MRDESTAPGVIEPGHLYTLPESKKRTGLGNTAFREAKRRGAVLKMLRVGTRCFVRGADLITFIEAASAAQEKLAARAGQRADTLAV